jgi:hypothetical protein
VKIVIRGKISRGHFTASGWYGKMERIRGKTVEVETKYLFRDQFNTVPIRGVSESGLRIMMKDVERIIDDARIGRSRCGWCGEHFESGVLFCPHCGKGGYVTPLIGRKR